MKICITSQGNTLESMLDPRFGRCAFFCIADTESGDAEFLENSPGGGGAGVAAGQLVINKGIEALITGNLGPNASQVLNSSKVAVYKGVMKTVSENIKEFSNGSLSRLSEIGESHAGMKWGKNL